MPKDICSLVDEIPFDAEVDTEVETLGEAKISSPMNDRPCGCFVDDEERVLLHGSLNTFNYIISSLY